MTNAIELYLTKSTKSFVSFVVIIDDTYLPLAFNVLTNSEFYIYLLYIFDVIFVIEILTRQTKAAKKKMIRNYLPHCCVGPIVEGFGRGSKELGCPTGAGYLFVSCARWTFCISM